VNKNYRNERGQFQVECEGLQNKLLCYEKDLISNNPTFLEEGSRVRFDLQVRPHFQGRQSRSGKFYVGKNIEILSPLQLPPSPGTPVTAVGGGNLSPGLSESPQTVATSGLSSCVLSALAVPPSLAPPQHLPSSSSGAVPVLSGAITTVNSSSNSSSNCGGGGNSSDIARLTNLARAAGGRWVQVHNGREYYPDLLTSSVKSNELEVCCYWYVRHTGNGDNNMNNNINGNGGIHDLISFD